MRVLGKLEQMGLTLLRRAAVALLGGVALVIVVPFIWYFWEEIRFNATTAESDARSLFISHCMRICVDPNEFDVTQPVSEPSSYKREYIFAWHEHNHPERRIEITYQAHDSFIDESEQFGAAHPWESRVDCQSAKR
jgi:ABC-type glycerol-3-phosphate transport system permease component